MKNTFAFTSPTSAILVAVLLFGAGCALTSPEDKVENLKSEKETHMEESGYNECLSQIEEAEAVHWQCTLEKLHVAGYADDFDCIENYGDPLCDFSRYNAQVEANNNCLEESSNTPSLTLLDCMKLLEE